MTVESTRPSAVVKLPPNIGRDRAAGEVVPVTAFGFGEPVVPAHASLSVHAHRPGVPLGCCLNDQDTPFRVVPAD